jgi:hypothetical protein
LLKAIAMKKFIRPFHFVPWIILFSLLVCTLTWGQELGDKSRSFWVDGGFGFGGSGFALSTHLSYELPKHHLVSLGLFTTAYPTWIFRSPNTTDATAFSIEYGKIKKSKAFLITYSVGIAFLDATRYGNPDHIMLFTDRGARSKTVGLIGEVQLIPSWKSFGVCVSSFVNVNQEYTYAGATIGLALGRVNY